jgi:hypothetical protein
MKNVFLGINPVEKCTFSAVLGKVTSIRIVVSPLAAPPIKVAAEVVEE